MAGATEISVSEHLSKIPAAVRPTVKAARQLVRTVAPKATEISYRSEPPRSSRAMWKIARYAVDGANVVGIGTFPRHATLWFYRGRELDDPSALLEGGGKDSRFITMRSAVVELVGSHTRAAGPSSVIKSLAYSRMAFDATDFRSPSWSRRPAVRPAGE